VPVLEHIVAAFELRYIPSDRFNLARHISARPCGFWLAKSGHHADEVRRVSHEVPVIWIDRSRSNF
jgi:hypothetical protein